jgi:ABC-type uncharacterized transport system substrate-binding protein
VEDTHGLASSAVTAIYAEPSPFDQLRLVSSLYKRRVNVAVLVSDKNEHLLPALRLAASLANVDLTIEFVSREDNLNRILNRVSDSPVLLAIPDHAIYNPENIRTILLTSYRHNQSVVGFSTAFVKAGAVASTYSEIDDVITQLDEMIRQFETSGRLPPPQFPKYFNVSVNDNVARSLNLIVDDGTRKLTRKPEGEY